MAESDGEATHDEYGYTGSILTPSQRKFLRDGPDEEQSADSQRMTRRRIRKRLGAAVVDFSRILTSDMLDIDDIELAFVERVATEFDPVPAKLIEEAIAVLFIGTMADVDEFDPETQAGHFEPDAFSETVASGVERGLSRMGHDVTNGKVAIEIDTDELSDEEEATELHQHSLDQLDRLHLANEISEREYISAILRKYNQRASDD